VSATHTPNTNTLLHPSFSPYRFRIMSYLKMLYWLLLWTFARRVQACTDILVTPGASTDGAMIAYNADSVSARWMKNLFSFWKLSLRVILLLILFSRRPPARVVWVPIPLPSGNISFWNHEKGLRLGLGGIPR
jgi:hypothetical protein